MKPSLSTLITQLGLTVKDEHLVQNAFVHRSYLNESKEFDNSNERLEYLGDAVLEMATSHYLYTTYPDFQEGMLTNMRAALVRTESLGTTADSLGFAKLLLMSKGEEATGGRNNQSILADTFEAFLGAAVSSPPSPARWRRVFFWRLCRPVSSAGATRRAGF